MKRTIVRYRVKPDQAERNHELVRAVFKELREASPAGIAYSAYLLDDGVTFVHMAEEDGHSLTDLAAFGEFRKEIGQRCEVPPEAREATLVGRYLAS